MCIQTDNYFVSLDIAVANVLKNAHIEESWLLRDEAYFRPQPLDVQLLNIDTIQIDCSTIGVEESE